MTELIVDGIPYRLIDGEWCMNPIIVTQGGIRGGSTTRCTSEWVPVDKQTEAFLFDIEKSDRVLSEVRAMFEVLFDEHCGGREDINFGALHDAILEYDKQPNRQFGKTMTGEYIPAMEE